MQCSSIHQLFKKSECIKIPLIQLTRDWIDAKSWNILDCQMVTILTYIFTGNILLLLLYFGCTAKQRRIRLDISFLCWFRSSGSSFMFSGVFLAEEVDGIVDKQSRDTTTCLLDMPLSLMQIFLPVYWWRTILSGIK